MNQPGDSRPGPIDPEHVERLYARALELSLDARAAFLADACGGDTRLEQEALSLLAHSDHAETFFNTLADAVVSPAAGLQVGRYRLTGLLGSGGMGTVYRAHDEQLDRIVAIKFLPHFLIADSQARGRFLQEARAAAALDHPNVCSIHEIGETAGGRPFIAMACYDGETLQQRLGRGPMSSDEAVGIALQLAQGLGAAHARGIIHRDVKPGNVMLLPDGSARLLDFGVAKLSDASATSPGTTPGTIAYMSPEQARGAAVDARSDLWSIGVVLYEMVSGVRPFRGGNDRVILQGIFHDEAAPLHQQVPATPPWLARVVERLLQKDPVLRYQGASELIRDLSPAAAGARRGLRAFAQSHRRAIGLTGASVVAALLCFWGWSVQRSTPAIPAPVSRAPTIAVMPFTVHGPELEVWRDGMVDLLSMGLDGVAGIRAVDSRTLLATWHRATSDQSAPGLELVLDVARQSHAQYAVVGSAVAAGPRIRLAADIYDVGTGRIAGPVQVEGPADSVLSLVDRLGIQALAVILRREPGDISAPDLASITTSSLLALKAYLQGEHHYRNSEFTKAIEAWEGAVRADTLFGLAYLGLADAYSWMASNDNSGQAQFRVSLDRAEGLKDRLPPRERATVEIRWAREHRSPDALATAREAVRKYPAAADLWYELGETYLHDAPALGRPEDAEAAFRNAAQLRPDMGPYRAHLLDLAFTWHPDSALVASNLDAYAQLAPESPRVRAGRLLLALAFGDRIASTRARSSLAEVDPATAAMVYTLMPHPRFRRWRQEVDSFLRPRLSPGERSPVSTLYFKTVGLADGHVREALLLLNDSLTPTSLKYGGAFYLALRGLPVPARVLAEKLAAARRDNALAASRIGTVSAAGTAALLGDWPAYDTLLAQLRTAATRSRDSGDSAAARYWDWGVRVAQAHGLWRKGRKEEALKMFQGTLPGDVFRFTLWSVGQLSLELGQTDRAERAFRALWDQDATPAYLQLARILDRSGRRAEAREAYQFVADAWSDADPDVQPLVREAQQAVTRLAATP